MVAHGETVGFQSQTVQTPERGERNVYGKTRMFIFLNHPEDYGRQYPVSA